jgi:hypothetical protein
MDLVDERRARKVRNEAGRIGDRGLARGLIVERERRRSGTSGVARVADPARAIGY